MKSKLKIIIPVIIAIVIIIIVAIVLGTTIHKQQLEKLEEQWKDRPKLVGDLCINIMYYTKQVDLELKKDNTTKEEREEKYNEIKALEEEIEKQSQEIDSMYGEIKGEPKTESQKLFKKLFSDMASLHGKMKDVSNKYFGYYSMAKLGYGNKTEAKEACHTLQQYYVDNVKYHIVYSEDNETMVERKKEAEKGVSSDKNLEHLKKTYGW